MTPMFLKIFQYVRRGYEDIKTSGYVESYASSKLSHPRYSCN